MLVRFPDVEYFSNVSEDRVYEDPFRFKKILEKSREIS